MKVAFLTLGCKVNYYETEKMMKDFRRHGFEVTGFNEDADVYIINTCTVTNIADRKSRKMIHRAKKKNPDRVVVAVGCYVESGGVELERDAAVDVAFSNKDKADIAEKVIAYLSGTGRMEKLAAEYGEMPEQHMTAGRTRKYVKVQDGCNQFCSYCMIPYVRGGGVLSSREETAVLEEMNRVAAQGYKEVVITGIHLSSYGVDRSGEKQFVALKGAPLAHLLREIDQIPGIERIRLGSLEPRIICEEFMEEISGVGKLCPHFHLSLQSGCDTVLKRMNRHYTAAGYRESCDRIRNYFKNPAITTDVIVGFPGETEEEFETTRGFVKEVGLASIHVFPYSMRNGTGAAKMENQIPQEVKHHRTDILLADARELSADYANSFVGKTERVLFEEMREVDGKEFLVGHNERYVLFGVSVQQAKSAGYEQNEIWPVLIGKGNIIF